MKTDIMLYTEDNLAIGQDFYFMLYPSGYAINTTVVVDAQENLHIRTKYDGYNKSIILEDFN